MPGIEPGAFHMQSERSTTELHPLSGELPFFIPTVSSCGIKKDIWVFLRRPGIEPGAQEWESCMLPLHQRRLNGGFLGSHLLFQMMAAPFADAKMWNASRFCVSSLRRGHANLLCIVPILVYVLPKQVQLLQIFLFTYFTCVSRPL